MSINTVKQSLQFGINKLREAKIPSPRLDAEILLGFVLGLNREKILISPDYKLSKNQYSRFEKLIKKRAKNYPIAYLIGKKEFYGIDFIVNESVLVPRPETELMVEEVIKYAKQSPRKIDGGYQILEIGTGSGCVALTLAKHLPKTKVTAVDISEKALGVARRNRKALGLKNIGFKKSDLLSDVKTIPNIIIANLPYLTKKELGEASIVREPKLALYGGKDGLAVYKRMLGQIKERLIDNDYHLTIFLEINPSQKSKLSKIIQEIFPKAEVEVKKDLARRDRLFIVKI